MKRMTVAEFLKTPDTYPLKEGEPYISGVMRAIPPDIVLTDLDEYFKPKIVILNPHFIHTLKVAEAKS